LAVAAFVIWLGAGVWQVRRQALSRQLKMLEARWVQAQPVEALQSALQAHTQLVHRLATQDSVPLTWFGRLANEFPNDIETNGETEEGKITKIFTFEGMEKKSVPEAFAGDIAMVAGLPNVYIGDSICENAEQTPMPAIAIDEPTIAINLLVNDSPFGGREGKFVTTRQIRERLEKELEVNVGLKIDWSAPDFFRLYGRAVEKTNRFVEHARVAGEGHIPADGVRQPQVVVRASGANAAPARWVPPVLHVSVGKLPLGTTQKMLT